MMHDPINKIIMQEIGLTIDNHQKVVDQDTREILKFKDKNLKYSSKNDIVITRNDVPFDPIDAKNMMTSLFNHFTEKINIEDGSYVSMYYDINSEEGTALEAVIDNNKITSDFYKNDALKYLDIIMKINGADTSGLKQYDIKPTKDTNRKKSRV